MTFQQIQKLLSLTQYAPKEEQNEIANLLTEAATQHPETRVHCALRKRTI